MAPTEAVQLLHSVKTMPTVSKTHTDRCTLAFIVLLVLDEQRHTHYTLTLGDMCVCRMSNVPSHMNYRVLCPAALYKWQPSPSIYFIIYKTCRKTFSYRGGPGGGGKNMGVKQVLWDQWCKKLFLLNAAWLTFLADTDKRMGASRTF